MRYVKESFAAATVSNEAAAAFVRFAIADHHSGSYAGFLVFADYLEEHADPRAAYVRSVVHELMVDECGKGGGGLYDLLLPFQGVCVCRDFVAACPAHWRDNRFFYGNPALWGQE